MCRRTRPGDWNEITDELGERFEIAFNTYKPFACGIVIHPTIDGCVQLRTEHGLHAEDIDRIELRVHPLVLELTGKTEPRTGSKASSASITACAAGIVVGRAGEAEFADEVVAHATTSALRRNDPRDGRRGDRRSVGGRDESLQGRA